MPRMNISIPADLKVQMDAVDDRRGRGSNVNWSAIACEAFRAELRRQRDAEALNATLSNLREQLGFGAHWQP